MRRASTILALTLLQVAAVLPAQQPSGGDPYLFAYFKEPGSQGVYLALSRDGYRYTPLNGGLPWLMPDQPGELMRDIFITRDTEGTGFRAVWTWAWHGNAVGTSTSPDLLTWAPQQRVEIMHDFAEVQNTWAPETYWDSSRHDWLLLWSSSFKADGEGLRLWASHTHDWKQFSKPEKYFDRGFPVIDATLFHRSLSGKKDDEVLVLKDQTADPLRYNERWAAGPGVDGPWGALSAPINESWSEGPSVVQVGSKAVVFYDHYRQPRARYEAVETSDWVHWTDASAKIQLPEGCKHGSFLRITEAEAQRLLARHDGPPADTPATAPAAR